MQELASTHAESRSVDGLFATPFIEAYSPNLHNTVLFTSPHLVKVNERIRLDGKPLPDALWAKHFWAVWDRLHQVGQLYN